MAYPLQQCLNERVSVLRHTYMAYPVQGRAEYFSFKFLLNHNWRVKFSDNATELRATENYYAKI